MALSFHCFSHFPTTGTLNLFWAEESALLAKKSRATSPSRQGMNTLPGTVFISKFERLLEGIHHCLGRAGVSWGENGHVQSKPRGDVRWCIGTKSAPRITLMCCSLHDGTNNEKSIRKIQIKETLISPACAFVMSVKFLISTFLGLAFLCNASLKTVTLCVTNKFYGRGDVSWWDGKYVSSSLEKRDQEVRTWQLCTCFCSEQSSVRLVLESVNLRNMSMMCCCLCAVLLSILLDQIRIHEFEQTTAEKVQIKFPKKRMVFWFRLYCGRNQRTTIHFSDMKQQKPVGFFSGSSQKLNGHGLYMRQFENH